MIRNIQRTEMNIYQLTVRRKAHSLVLDIPHAVEVFQQAPADQLKILEDVDERLARGPVALEGPDVELAAGNGEVERFASLGREGEGDLCGEARDLAAGYTVRAGFRSERLDVGRYQSVHSLGVPCG